MKNLSSTRQDSSRTENPAYQSQDSRQSLEGALAEYYRVNQGAVFPPNSLPLTSAAFFRSHDICHVMFGLGTSAADEAVVDTRIMLASTVSARAYVGSYDTVPELGAILEKTGFWTFTLGAIKAIPRMARAWIEARRIPKKWPWVPPENYLGRPLCDLRSEHGIRICRLASGGKPHQGREYYRVDWPHYCVRRLLLC